MHGLLGSDQCICICGSTMSCILPGISAPDSESLNPVSVVFMRLTYSVSYSANFSGSNTDVYHGCFELVLESL